MSKPGGVDLAAYSADGFERGRPRLVEAAWLLLQAMFFGSWLPGSRWRAGLLRLFGARIGRGVVLKPAIQVKFPWRLSIGDHSWIGERAWLDNLTEIRIGSYCCISQGAYLCTGNHDWTDPAFKLVAKPIVMCDGAWVAARAIICPGVTLGECSVAAVGSVVTHDIPTGEIHAGNPAGFARKRVLRTTESAS